MATLRSELVLAMVDKVTAPARGVAATVANLSQNLEANNRRLDAMRGRMVEAMAVGYGLARSLAAPITTAADFEAIMFRVGDATKASAGQMKNLTDLAREQGRTTAFTATQSGEAIEMLAKNNLAVSDILGGAAEATLQLAAATGSELSPAADLATDVMQNFNKKAHELKEVNNGIVGVLMASKFGFEDYQLAIAQAGGVAGGVGVELEDFNAAIAATSSLFASGSDAGTSFKTFLQRLIPASAKAEGIMKKLGLNFFDANGQMKDMASIAEELKVGMAGLSEEARNDALSTIFGTDAMRTAIGLMEQGADGLNAMHEAIAKGNAKASADARMEGFNGALKEFNSIVEDLNISIGNALLPALTGILETFGPMVRRLSELAQAYPKVTSTVIALTAGLVGLRVAAIAARFAFFWMRGAYLSAAIAGLKGIGGGIKAATLAFAPFTAAARSARAAMVGFAATASIMGTGGALKQVGASLIGLLNPMRLVTGAIRVMKVALISTGIGAILVAIGTAGAWIYQNWAGIKEMFSGIAEGIKTAFPAASGIIDGVSSAVSTLFGWFQKLTGPVDATAQEWREFGVTVGEQIGGIIAAVAEFPGKVLAILSSIDLSAVGLSMMTSLLNGIKNGAQAALDYVSGIGSRIKGAISGAASSAGSWISNKVSGLTGGGVDGARAAGGPIAGGRTYLVGEQGPELITPSRSGYVHTAKETAAMAGRGGGGGITVNLGGITITEASNARQIAHELGRALQTELAGIQTNSGWAVA